MATFNTVTTTVGYEITGGGVKMTHVIREKVKNAVHNVK